MGTRKTLERRLDGKKAINALPVIMLSHRGVSIIDVIASAIAIIKNNLNQLCFHYSNWQANQESGRIRHRLEQNQGNMGLKA